MLRHSTDESRIRNLQSSRYLEVENMPGRDQVQKDRNIPNGKRVQTWPDNGQDAAKWYCTKFEDYDPCKWMSKVNDSALLKDLTIPATHQSSCLDTAIGLFNQITQSPKCQDSGICCQLRQGIRYLDNRIDVNVGEMRIVHGKRAPATFYHLLSQQASGLWIRLLS
jgi:hypothetical protein